MSEGESIIVNEDVAYVAPELRELGDFVALTLACSGFGGEDGAAKMDGANPFIFSQPDFGDPGFCS